MCNAMFFAVENTKGHVVKYLRYENKIAQV